MHQQLLFIAVTFLSDLNVGDYKPDPYMLQLCKDWALSAQIIDTKSESWVFVRPSGFASDVNYIRNKLPLLIGAPYVADANRLPPLWFINQCRDFNIEYKESLINRMGYEPEYIQEQMAEAVAEADYLYSIYDNMRDAQLTVYVIATRRKALKFLLDELGQDYYTGNWPPHVPFWRFNKIE